jgi:hypothetical protein
MTPKTWDRASLSDDQRRHVSFAAVNEPDAADMLARYDDQLRTVVPDPLPEGLRIERDGPLVRYIGYANGGGIGYRDLDGIEGAELDDLIDRQIRAFAERGEAFEWKSHGHDRPADLPDRLLAHGFEPEDLETIVIASVAAIALEASAPDGVSLREVTERADFVRIGAMEDAIWRDGRNGWLADSLEKERAAIRMRSRSSSQSPPARWCVRVGSDSWQARTSRRCGVAARSPSGGVGASIARWSPTGPTSRRRGGSASCRWTRRRRADRSWSAWASSPSPRRRRTSGRRRRAPRSSGRARCAPSTTAAMLRDMGDAEPGPGDLIARAVDVCAHDDRIAAVFLSGSRARGEADDYSDIDLCLIVRDDGTTR